MHKATAISNLYQRLFFTNTLSLQYRTSKQGKKMKKLITITLLMGALASSAFAHHMAVYDDAGINIPSDSPHLDMLF